MTKRNVFLVTVDSVRADYCGFLNDSVNTTPHLNRLVDNGVVCLNAIAPGPRTLSSVPVTHTGEPFGRTDLDTSVYQNRIDRIKTHISTHETIAEQFSEAGYTTLGFSTNPWTSRRTHFETGFDRFEDFEDEQDGILRRAFDNTPLRTPARFVDHWIKDKAWFTLWPKYYDEILSMVKSIDEPYFLWVFLLDTHNPYFPARDDRVESSTLRMYYSMLRGNSMLNQTESMSAHKGTLPPTIEANIKRAYRDSIRSIDRFVEELWGDLRDTDPVVAVHSDHGEAFNDHGTYGHQAAVYEENVRVPFALFNVEDSYSIQQSVSMEVLPDVLSSYANDESVPLNEWTTEYAFARTEDSETIAVRGSEWKYIRSGDNEELYYLSDDPGELDDRSGRDEGRLDDLRRVLDQYLDSLPRIDIQQGTDASDQSMKEQLDALGYIS